MQKTEISRRILLKNSAVAAGGLIVGFYLPTGFGKLWAQAPGVAKVPELPNAFIQILPDNSITFIINKLEMGQGVNTSMAQLIAEELGCAWEQIKSVSAPVAPVYNHTFFPTQMTGGSSALSSSWDQHRRIGAALREMLKAAAAEKWGVPVSQLSAKDGFVVHSSRGKLSFGELAEAANKMPLPQKPSLKKTADFTFIGKSMRRVDAPDKVNGKAVFGLDVRIPDMLYAVVARPPIAGAKIGAIDDVEARAIKGVIDVVQFGDRVAVLAKNTHVARLGRDALQITWDSSGIADFSDASIMAGFKKQSVETSLLAADRGTVSAAMKKAKRTIAAEYEFPFLAHAPMEPMNCTITFDGQQAELWSGHQMPAVDRDVAAGILGLIPDKVKVNTTYAGGSFGRRGSKNSDYTVEAAELVKIVKKPLKVVWTREDDMGGGFYRPMTFHRVTLGLDSKSQLLAWDHHIVGQSVIGGSMFEGMMVKGGLEPMVTEGVSDTHYNLANFRCHQSRMKSPVTTLWWRSVGHTHTAYVMETMIDELAHAMKKDPLQLRKKLLKAAPRHLAVLALLEKETGWGKKHAPKDRAWGLAIHESFNSVVGQVVEVSMKEGMPVVHKVWCAVHCGLVVNPEGAKTQVEGAIAYGLSAALHGEIKIEHGRVVTSNFDHYPVLRMSEMPEVQVAFVKTAEQPTGLGEPGLPPIAPAVANAVFLLTGKRVRQLPFAKGLASA